MSKSVVYFNNKFVSEEEAVVPITTHALHYGTGCFEGIRAYFNEEKKAFFIFRLEDHYKRFLNSCKTIFINPGHSLKELCQITVSLLEKNFEQTDIYIRPLAFKADLAVGNFNLKSLKDGLAIYTVALGRYLNQKGVRANISSWERISGNAIPPRAKITGAYMNTALAKTESLLNGFEEALLLDKNGNITEGSAENFFMIKDGKLITPAVSDDILVGITRDTIIHLAKKELGVEVIERSIARAEVYSADEAFVVGTGAEVSPVIEIDNRSVGDGKIGKLSEKLRTLYSKLVHGQLEGYNHWLTEVTK